MNVTAVTDYAKLGQFSNPSVPVTSGFVPFRIFPVTVFPEIRCYCP